MKWYLLFAVFIFSAFRAKDSFNYRALKGCWYSEHGKTHLEACWNHDKKGSSELFLEVNAKGDTLQQEALRIDWQARTLVMTRGNGKDRKKQQVKFHCTSSSKDKLKFENLLNDYPRKMSFTLLPGNRFEYYVQGNLQGVYKEESFLFERRMQP